jgi:hypothetical protein
MLSLFNWKSEIKKVFCKENIDTLKDFAEQKIISYVEKEMSGPQKKAQVTAAVISFISTNFVTKNSIVGFFVQLLIQFTPFMVQYLYDALKKCVDGLTVKA